MEKVPRRPSPGLSVPSPGAQLGQPRLEGGCPGRGAVLSPAGPSAVLAGGAFSCVGGRGGCASSGSLCLGPAALSSSLLVAAGVLAVRRPPASHVRHDREAVPSRATVRGHGADSASRSLCPCCTLQRWGWSSSSSRSSDGSKACRFLVCSVLSCVRGMTPKLCVRKPSVTPAVATPERTRRSLGSVVGCGGDRPLWGRISSHWKRGGLSRGGWHVLRPRPARGCVWRAACTVAWGRLAGLRGSTCVRPRPAGLPWTRGARLRGRVAAHTAGWL